MRFPSLSNSNSLVAAVWIFSWEKNVSFKASQDKSGRYSTINLTDLGKVSPEGLFITKLAAESIKRVRCAITAALLSRIVKATREELYCAAVRKRLRTRHTSVQARALKYRPRKRLAGASSSYISGRENGNNWPRPMLNMKAVTSYLVLRYSHEEICDVIRNIG